MVRSVLCLAAGLLLASQAGAFAHDAGDGPESALDPEAAVARSQAAVGGSLGFQQSVIVDEAACFAYDFAYDRGAGRVAGNPIRVTARLSEYGRPLAGAKAVAVEVSAPAISRGNLLAE